MLTPCLYPASFFVPQKRPNPPPKPLVGQGLYLAPKEGTQCLTAGYTDVLRFQMCIRDSIKAGMSNSQLEMKKAVDCGYWHLYRYDPRRVAEGKNPFQLDSPEQMCIRDSP